MKVSISSIFLKDIKVACVFAHFYRTLTVISRTCVRWICIRLSSSFTCRRLNFFLKSLIILAENLQMNLLDDSWTDNLHGTDMNANRTKHCLIPNVNLPVPFFRVLVCTVLGVLDVTLIFHNILRDGILFNTRMRVFVNFLLKHQIAASFLINCLFSLINHLQMRALF